MDARRDLLVLPPASMGSELSEAQLKKSRRNERDRQRSSLKRVQCPSH